MKVGYFGVQKKDTCSTLNTGNACFLRCSLCGVCVPVVLCVLLLSSVRVWCARYFDSEGVGAVELKHARALVMRAGRFETPPTSGSASGSGGAAASKSSLASGSGGAGVRVLSDAQWEAAHRLGQDPRGSRSGRGLLGDKMTLGMAFHLLETVELVSKRSACAVFPHGMLQRMWPKGH